ncbi:hypothetical protein KFK09_009024 [Dendrobium nobile]|uniref:Uncharacterized protein n=1 Tax=Dendrobium nobile TaxID=94219 RepID=A0A8T3BMA7_DENNO|nr:hypothetical protein KFK09_009024 [Dendrobium nobile]
MELRSQLQLHEEVQSTNQAYGMTAIFSRYLMALCHIMEEELRSCKRLSSLLLAAQTMQRLLADGATLSTPPSRRSANYSQAYGMIAIFSRYLMALWAMCKTVQAQ